jgi:hypothetical protein
MKSILIALALLTAACTPTAPSPVGEDLRSTERGVTPDGYNQFCRDEPQSELCK